MTIEQPGAITKTIVPDEKRLSFMPRIFGKQNMLKVEHNVYFAMAGMCESYDGGLWDFFDLSNGGGYLSLRSNERFSISVDGNGFSGEMSADAASITANLFALSLLSFETRDDTLIERFHQLRDYVSEHPEAALIMRAVD